MADVIPKERREQFLSDQVERLIDGAYYTSFYGSGKSQVNLDEDATDALVKLRSLIELERGE